MREYVGQRSEAAFAELVRRHVDQVYSTALRMVRDLHLAQDVSLSVFVAPAQSARQLTDRPVLAGWPNFHLHFRVASILHTAQITCWFYSIYIEEWILED